MTKLHNVVMAWRWPSADALRRLRERVELQGTLGLLLWITLIVLVVRAGNG